MNKSLPSYNDLLEKVKKLENELERHKENNSYSHDNLNAVDSYDIIEHSTNVFYAHTPDNLITYMSPRVQDLLGYTVEEAKIRWTEFVTDNPENTKGIEYTSKAIKTGERQSPYELELKKKNGQKIWVEVRESPVIQRGKVIAMTGSLTDITEQKLAREKLKESEQSFKTIFENTGAATCIIDIEGTVILANQRFSELAGVPLDEIEHKKNWKDFVVKEDLKRMEHQHNLRREDSKKALRTYEFRFIDNNNTIREILLFIDLIPGTTNSVASMLDITLRKKAEREIKQHRENYQSLFEQAADGILVGINQGTIIEANESICKLTRYDKDELVGQNISILFPEDELKINPLRYDLVRKGKSVILERNIRAKNGKVIPVEMNTKMLNDGRMQALFRDITKRKTAENALRESEANLASVIESTDKSIWSIDKNYKILTLNYPFATKFKDYFGITLKKGMKLIDYLPEKIKEKWTKRYERVFKGEKVSLIESFEFPEGTRYFEVVLHPIGDQTNITGVSARSNDITDRIIAEENLRRVNKELMIAKEKAEESDRLKSAFLANMSHEIRTPMNGILGFTELLKDPELTGRQQKFYIDIIQKSGNRMLNTVNDLIDISKIETGQMEISQEEVNISDEVENLYNFFAPEAKNKGLELFLSKKSPGFEMLIKTDRTKLNSILNNLIKNAIKYTEKGAIEITYEKRNESIHFHIKDSGPGIPMDKQMAIFERFTQVEDSYSRANEGSGLGLSITKAYVELLGGEIWLESELDRGSTFSFNIPVNGRIT